MKVSELIGILQNLPSNDDIKIIDADTAWLLNPAYVGKDFVSVCNATNEGYISAADLKSNEVYFVTNYWGRS